MAEAVIKFDHVNKAYGDTPVLRDFCLEVPEGECLTMIGRSGCGKTTALKLVNGLLTPDSGSVYVRGQDVSATDRIALRRSIGYVIQSTGLFPHMTVGKNIAYTPSLSRMWDRETERSEVARLLKTVGLEPELADRYPSELSGGQRQRVGIARALAAKPSIMLMDEPFGSVDEITRRSLQDELRSLGDELRLTVLFVTHDIGEAFRLGDRVLVMESGRISQLDTPERIAAEPADDFIRELIEDRK